MSSVCRSCLSRKQKYYFSLETVLYEFQQKSILEILNAVTASSITFTDNLPKEICQVCLMKLKNAYCFLNLFRKTQTLLQHRANLLSDEENIEGSRNVQEEQEKSLTQVLDPQGEDRVVILNDDGSTYVDMVQEIFGTDERGSKNISENSKYATDDSGKKTKIIMVSIDDVIKEKHKNVNEKPNFTSEEQEMLCTSESIKSEDEIDSQEVFWDSVDEDGIFETVYEEDQQDVWSNDEEDNEQNFSLDLPQSKEKSDRNLNNIQIVTIDDIKKEDDTKKRKIITVEDVLNIKPRKKKKTLNEDMQIFNCNSCDSIFNTRRKLMTHKLRLHNPNWRQKFRCEVCGLECKTASAQKHHMLKHQNIRYSCSQCDKSYLTKSKLKVHIERVHEKKFDNKYLCTECGKGFKFSNALDYHMRQHSNSKNFVCRFCGFASLALSGLKRHERTHTGERPYSCKYCSKSFAGSAEKQKHEFCHEGVFRYKCRLCDKKFIQTYNMKVHWMQHRGPYICEICSRGFADAEILKFHYAHSHKIKNVVIKEEGDIDDLDQ